ncbi:ATP-binding cassette domain-containing protein [Guyparkeria hydrothermalis]|uniref:ABC transporter ATP-binding protein n=1 Tax=Guyparkeria hydrothermalis TaxID=923 RepID=UPI0020210410|nr:ATP-binding cassette domain-containing protein [Guyparkeria hydrothermalis]MCL7744845.1 ATP-binding cassette domain-containing protein [Guyparkeria hydrothermalis]
MSSSKTPRDDSQPILTVEGVTQTVRTPEPLTIVHEAHLQICPGEAVALVGPSGAGKSTLLALMAGLDTPSTGRIRLAGESLENLDEDGRAAVRAGRVGFVFQSFQLIDGLNALENVALPLELAGERRAEARAREALVEVGLGERLAHLPRQLSGGEQQRVALARAFVIEPDILFADEPTGSLDTATGEHVIDLLFRLRERHHTTLVLVTHDPALAARCDRGFDINAGRVSDWQPDPDALRGQT